MNNEQYVLIISIVDCILVRQLLHNDIHTQYVGSFQVLCQKLSHSYVINPNQAGGGGKWPPANLNDFFSANECPIDLKPSCIFTFVRCLDVYKKRLINLDLGGTLEGL